MTDITNPFEIMIVVISRLVKNGETAATGTLSPIPAAALLLAQKAQVTFKDLHSVQAKSNLKLVRAWLASNAVARVRRWRKEVEPW